MAFSAKHRSFKRHCEICLQPASSYHYNVLSCDGCKTFFRRSVLSRLTFKCIKNNDQCLAADNRNEGRIRCRSCRFQRCVEKGMDPAAVNNMKVRLSQDFETTSVTSSSSEDSQEQQMDQLVQEITCTEGDIQAATSYLENIEEQVAVIRRDGLTLAADIELLAYVLQSPAFKDIPFSSLQHIKSEFGESSSNPPVPPWLLKDVSSAVHYANMFDDFQLSSVESKAQIIVSTVFPLMVAMQSYDVFIDDLQPSSSQYSSIDQRKYLIEYTSQLEMIRPFVDMKVDRTEFLMIRTVALFDALLQAVNHSSIIKEKVNSTRNFYVQHLFGHIRRSNDQEQSNERLTDLLDLVQTFLHNVNNGTNTNHEP